MGLKTNSEKVSILEKEQMSKVYGGKKAAATASLEKTCSCTSSVWPNYWATATA